jgi:predicted glycogen debranching enzyme
MDQREWLETNGTGGYASSTVCGMNTRRYHGLLVAAMHPPVGRMVLLSKLDERFNGIDLGANQYPGTIHPRGFEHLVAFERGIFPTFDYEIAGARLRKTVAAIHGENTTVVVYELLEGEGELELRPFMAGRDYHGLRRASDGIPRLPLHFGVPGARFDAAPDWYYDFEYAIEQERGLDAHEDLFTPGTYALALKRGERVAVIASTEDVHGRDGLELVAAERRRREGVIDNSSLGGRLGRRLALAADQFIVRRGAEGRTIIAGYPWFTDWGRDTMIALPGLCLATGRFDDARRILFAFAESVSEGMLPNRFPDGGEAPEYNTVDATLWFFVAVQRYLDYTRDHDFVRTRLLPVLRDIVQWHIRGTRHGIRVDEAGLLVAGVPGDQLTWMDAKIGDWVVTPRHGKAVEINALWYNALAILAMFEQSWGSPDAARELSVAAARVRCAFRQAFWNDTQGCLYDVIEGEQRDASIRPNQIFAIALPYALIDGVYAEKVLDTVERHLLTPVGLRSLAPSDPRFAPRYTGGPRERDAVYHQGTVWSWLLGPYLTALVRVRGDAAVAQGLRILARFEAHLDEVCIGSISEIFDGAEFHAPRGCCAQAWSVGEILRAALETLRLGDHGRRTPAPFAKREAHP